MNEWMNGIRNSSFLSIKEGREQHRPYARSFSSSWDQEQAGSLQQQEAFICLMADWWVSPCPGKSCCSRSSWALGKVHTSAEVSWGEETEAGLLVMLSLVLDPVAGWMLCSDQRKGSGFADDSCKSCFINVWRPILLCRVALWSVILLILVWCCPALLTSRCKNVNCKGSLGGLFGNVIFVLKKVCFPKLLDCGAFCCCHIQLAVYMLSVYPQRILFSRHEKIKKKDPKHIFASEEMNGEVRFSTHLPQPHSLCG